jgi:tetratricopeptide (TPR) repeat protein
MARRVKKTSKKVAPIRKKAVKAPTRKSKPAPKAGKKTTKKTKPAPRKATKTAKSKAAPKKAASKKKKTPAAAPKSMRGKPAPAKAPRRPPKRSPAQVEELRIAKERRKAQERQADYYDKAIKAFQSRHFQRALSLFEKAADGPNWTLADRARVHVAICTSQVKPTKIKLKTADEFYDYGIRLINEGRFEEAQKRFNQALRIQPRGAHIHFAVAVLSALTRDTAGTYKSLKRAIELDPRNRVLALNDADLAAAAKDPTISQLLHVNIKTGADP